MINSVLFDLDGVIIDSTPVMEFAFRQSYKNIIDKNLEPPFEEFISHSGDSLKNIFTTMNLPVEEMFKSFRKYSIENINKIKIFDFVMDLITKLNFEGFKIGIVTGKEKDRTMMILEKHAIDKYFDTVVASNEVANPKPHPESLFLALKNIKSKPQNAIYIGDAKNDILASNKAQIISIGVTWGVETEKQLQKHQPDFIVDDAEKIYQIIKNHNLNYKRKTTNKTTSC